MEPGVFVDALARAEFGDAHNFYRDGDGAGLRRSRLRAYLGGRAEAPLLLVGEAPGYRGARVSGIPFTSERQLTGKRPRRGHCDDRPASADRARPAGRGRALERGAGASPPVGRADDQPPAHAARGGGRRPFVDALAAGRRTIAVGRVAGRALGVAWIRHPSRGGASAFREGLLQSALGGRVVRRFSVPR